MPKSNITCRTSGSSVRAGRVRNMEREKLTESVSAMRAAEP